MANAGASAGCLPNSAALRQLTPTAWNDAAAPTAHYTCGPQRQDTPSAPSRDLAHRDRPRMTPHGDTIAVEVHQTHGMAPAAHGRSPTLGRASPVGSTRCPNAPDMRRRSARVERRSNSSKQSSRSPSRCHCGSETSRALLHVVGEAVDDVPAVDRRLAVPQQLRDRPPGGRRRLRRPQRPARAGQQGVVAVEPKTRPARPGRDDKRVRIQVLVGDLHRQLDGAAAEHRQVGRVGGAPLGVGIADHAAGRDPLLQRARVGHVLRVPGRPRRRPATPPARAAARS